MLCMMGRFDTPNLWWCVRCHSWYIDNQDSYTVIRCSDFGDAASAGQRAIKGCPNCTHVVSRKPVEVVKGHFVEDDADLRKGLCTVIKRGKNL